MVEESRRALEDARDNNIDIMIYRTQINYKDKLKKYIDFLKNNTNPQ